MKRFIPCCPVCKGTDLEWKTYAFFKVLDPMETKDGVPHGVNVSETPCDIDWEGDGEIFCIDCEDYVGSGRGWDSFKEESSSPPVSSSGAVPPG